MYMMSKDTAEWLCKKVESYHSDYNTLTASFREGRFYDGDKTCADVSMDELVRGIEIEYEHTPDDVMACKIALDHLAECDDYYTRLQKMERECQRK